MDGFELMQTASPFNLLVGPYYYKLVDAGIVFGLRVEEKHCNSAGNLHGGLINAMADIALGNNIGMQLAADPSPDTEELMIKRKGGPIATVSMSTDFVGSASKDDWVEIEVDIQRIGQSLAFANAYLTSHDERIARISAIYKIMR